MQELEPTPSQELETPPAAKSTPEPKDDSALKIVDSIVRLNASAKVPDDVDAVYELIKGDRPLKIPGNQVGFAREHGEMGCRSCWHFALFPARARKKEQQGACEVVRPEDGNPSVNPTDFCRLWSADGLEFPHRATSESEPTPNN